MGKAKFYIGTSGWHYAHWKGPFYPKDLPEKHFLAHYMEQFSTVEINRTFYSLPQKSVFIRYAEAAPASFIFSVKASRFITHVKRLKDPRKSLQRFFSRVKGLKEHLGPILFQLPPRWKVNPDRLRSFLKVLPKGYRYAFEFRDPTWLKEEIYELLREYNAAFCIYELDHFSSPKIITADFVYVRLHGPKGAYTGNYSLKTLKKWAAVFRKEARKRKDIYCYFDNDQVGYAPLNAQTVRSLLRIIQAC